MGLSIEISEQDKILALPRNKSDNSLREKEEFFKLS
jgi:hypothetical protein